MPEHKSLAKIIEEHGIVGGFSVSSYPRPDWMTDEDYQSLPLAPELPDVAVGEAMKRALRQGSLWLSLWSYGQCGECNNTWDRCRCPDRDERFRLVYREKAVKLDA